MFKNLSAIPTAPAVKPRYPVGCLLDIPTGEFIQTPKGNWIMMGGYQPISSITGPGNSFKTDLILFSPLTVFGRIKCSSLGVYDTEDSLAYKRFNDRRARFAGLESFDFTAEQYSESPRFLLWQRSGMEGDQWFENIKKFAAEKIKDKNCTMTLPIDGPNGQAIKVKPPTALVIDSLSNMSSDTIQENIVDKNAIGESGANTIFMRDGAMKTQMIMQLGKLAATSGLHFSLTAHVGNTIEMSAYAPKPLSLTFTRNGTKQKGVPEKFQFINDYVGEIYNSKPLYNSSSDKSPKYPLSEVDRISGNNDLFQVVEVSSRNKSGQSGVTRGIIVSQREGVLATLTEFDYIKETCDRNGIEGSKVSFHMDLYPDVKLGRTTMRNLFDTDHRLRTAVRLTAELNQMRLLWNHMEDVICTPKELYDDIKALGYDWNQLLDTRYWWVPVEEEHDQEYNELTIMDLLEMRQGRYHPYWLDKDKKTVLKKWEPKKA